MPRVLIVDDEETIRMLLVEEFELEDWEALFAEDGEAARELLSKNTFDLVISDIRMPRMSGVELLKLIRESYSGLPCFLITGYTDTANEVLRSARPDALFTKPFDFEVIFAAAKKAVGSAE